MRLSKSLVVIAVCVLGLSLLAVAGQNQFGVADSRKVSFTSPIKVGNVLLPQGDYLVLHTMEGQDHVMIFKQLNTKKPAEARVKCQLVTLASKAPRDEQTYIVNGPDERILHALIFRGDAAQHVF